MLSYVWKMYVNMTFIHYVTVHIKLGTSSATSVLSSTYEQTKYVCVHVCVQVCVSIHE